MLRRIWTSPAEFEQGQKSAEFEQKGKRIRNSYLTGNYLLWQLKLYLCFKKLLFYSYWWIFLTKIWKSRKIVSQTSWPCLFVQIWPDFLKLGRVYLISACLVQIRANSRSGSSVNHYRIFHMINLGDLSSFKVSYLKSTDTHRPSILV